MIEVTMRVQSLMKDEPDEWRQTLLNPDRIEVVQQHPDDDGLTTIWMAGMDDNQGFVVKETPVQIRHRILMWHTMKEVMTKEAHDCENLDDAGKLLEQLS